MRKLVPNLNRSKLKKGQMLIKIVVVDKTPLFAVGDSIFSASGQFDIHFVEHFSIRI